MVKIEIKDELELRDIEDLPEIHNNVQYHQVRSLSNQVQSIWGEDEAEVKPKVEQIDIDLKRQPVIKLDRDYLRKHHRTKWTDHILSTHRHRAFLKACQLCKKMLIFDSPTKLIEHYNEFHQKETTSYKCALCYYSSRRQRDLILHWDRRHKDGPMHIKPQCKSLPIGKCTASRIANDPNNIWIGDDELVHSMFFKEPFECDICSKMFNFPKSLRNHKMMYHSKENEIQWHKCDQCDKVFRLEGSLRMHKNIHKLKKFPCVFCSKQYSDPNTLRMHELTHRNEMLTCEFCDMKFINKLAQCYHYRKFHFDLLRKQDKVTGGLNKWFQGRRTFECYRCKFPGGFGVVRNHMAKVCNFKGNNPINCKDCIRKFDTMKQMKEHYKLTHDKELDLMNVPPKRRTYECHICRYTEKGLRWFSLKKHLTKEHPDKSKSKCDICHATFRTWEHLRCHQRIHVERTVKCRFCPKLFKHQNKVNAHEKTHTKPMKCERCDYRCAHGKDMRYHLKKKCTGQSPRKDMK